MHLPLTVQLFWCAKEFRFILVSLVGFRNCEHDLTVFWKWPFVTQILRPSIDWAEFRKITYLIVFLCKFLYITLQMALLSCFISNHCNKKISASNSRICRKINVGYTYFNKMHWFNLSAYISIRNGALMFLNIFVDFILFKYMVLC